MEEKEKVNNQVEEAVETCEAPEETAEASTEVKEEKKGFGAGKKKSDKQDKEIKKLKEVSIL